VKSYKYWDFACHEIILYPFEKPKAYHQVVQLYEGNVMEYHSKDSIDDKWVEDISMQIIPFFHVLGLFFTPFLKGLHWSLEHDRWPTTIKVATNFTTLLPFSP
jgi:hypothetical protein